MATTVRPKIKHVLPSAWVVRALLRGGRRYHCESCGEPMFVRYASGLCPWCYNGVRNGTAAPGLGTVKAVPDHLALVGVLDDPAIEGQGGSS